MTWFSIWDTLHMALGSQEEHCHSRSRLDYVQEAKRTILRLWNQAAGDRPSFWFICFWPQERDQALIPLKCIRYVMATPEEECLRRAIADARPTQQVADIKRWFSEHRIDWETGGQNGGVMPRQRLPMAVALASGAVEKDRKRYANREGELDRVAQMGPLGPPMEDLTDTQKRIWEEVVAKVPEGVLCYSDRFIIEFIVRLQEKANNEPLGVVEQKQLDASYASVGLTKKRREELAQAASALSAGEGDVLDRILRSREKRRGGGKETVVEEVVQDSGTDDPLDLILQSSDALERRVFGSSGKVTLSKESDLMPARVRATGEERKSIHFELVPPVFQKLQRLRKTDWLG